MTEPCIQTLTPGYIGLSIGETTSDVQAIVWAGDNEFYFYPVTRAVSLMLEMWRRRGGTERELHTILPNEDHDVISMFIWGTPEETEDDYV